VDPHSQLSISKPASGQNKRGSIKNKTGLETEKVMTKHPAHTSKKKVKKVI